MSSKSNSNAKPNPDQHHSSFHLPAHSNAGLVFLLGRKTCVHPVQLPQYLVVSVVGSWREAPLTGRDYNSDATSLSVKLPTELWSWDFKTIWVQIILLVGRVGLRNFCSDRIKGSMEMWSGWMQNTGLLSPKIKEAFQCYVQYSVKLAKGIIRRKRNYQKS